MADSKGPLSNRIVIISPIDAKDGKSRNVFIPVGGGRMESVNPRTESGAKGEFSVVVPRSLFRPPKGCVGCTPYRKGELDLGVFTARGGGQMSSSLESAVVKFDEQAATVDAGRVVLQPLK